MSNYGLQKIVNLIVTDFSPFAICSSKKKIPSVEGFDLNIELADVSFADDPVTVYLINVSQDDPIAVSR